MKKTILVILAVMFVFAVFAACEKGRPQDDDNFDGSGELRDSQQIKAIIQEVYEGSLLVQPLEGLEGIDIIYLNITDETVVNMSQEAPTLPGTIVYAVVDTAIMESYPPQVFVFEITKTEIDPQITLEPYTDDIVGGGDTQPAPENYLTGKVDGIDGENYTVDVLSSSMFDGQITINIPADVYDVDMPIEVGFLIGVYVDTDGEDPIYAQKVVFSEPDSVIQLDDRETISGYLKGMFPQAVYSLADEHINAQAGVPFAIGLEENCESDWFIMMTEGVEVVANGQSEPGEDGMLTNYFGLRIDKPGEYGILFIHESADDPFEFTFYVTVE